MAAIERLNAELVRELTFHWNDPPLDPAWTAPDAATVQQIESADGLFAERFAMCQTMPLEQFHKVVESLRPTGYRPTRFRPYTKDKSVQVALGKQGFEFQQSLQAFRGLDGQQKRCGVCTKRAGDSELSWDQTPLDYLEQERLGSVWWDVDLSRASDPETTRVRYQRQLAAAEDELKETADDLNAHYLRGVASFYLGNDAKALEDLDVS